MRSSLLDNGPLAALRLAILGPKLWTTDYQCRVWHDPFNIQGQYIFSRNVKLIPIGSVELRDSSVPEFEFECILLREGSGDEYDRRGEFYRVLPGVDGPSTLVNRWPCPNGLVPEEPVNIDVGRCIPPEEPSTDTGKVCGETSTRAQDDKVKRPSCKLKQANMTPAPLSITEAFAPARRISIDHSWSCADLGSISS